LALLEYIFQNFLALLRELSCFKLADGNLLSQYT
jgi:hypothetical protein